MVLPKVTIIFLSLFGAIFLGTIIHESVHIVQAEKVYSICYDVGKNSFMHVEGNINDKNNLSLELPAYIISILITILLILCIVIDFKLKY